MRGDVFSVFFLGLTLSKILQFNHSSEVKAIEPYVHLVATFSVFAIFGGASRMIVPHSFIIPFAFFVI